MQLAEDNLTCGAGANAVSNPRVHAQHQLVEIFLRRDCFLIRRVGLHLLQERVELLLHLGRGLLPFVDHRLGIGADLFHLAQNCRRIAIGIEAFAGALHGFVFIALTDCAAEIFCFILEHGAGPLVRIRKVGRVTRIARRARDRDH